MSNGLGTIHFNIYNATVDGDKHENCVQFIKKHFTINAKDMGNNSCTTESQFQRITLISMIRDRNWKSVLLFNSLELLAYQSSLSIVFALTLQSADFSSCGMVKYKLHPRQKQTSS